MKKTFYFPKYSFIFMYWNNIKTSFKQFTILYQMYLLIFIFLIFKLKNANIRTKLNESKNTRAY